MYARSSIRFSGLSHPMRVSAYILSSRPSASRHRPPRFIGHCCVESEGPAGNGSRSLSVRSCGRVGERSRDATMRARIGTEFVGRESSLRVPERASPNFGAPQIAGYAAPLFRVSCWWLSGRCVRARGGATGFGGHQTRIADPKVSLQRQSALVTDHRACRREPDEIGRSGQPGNSRSCPNGRPNVARGGSALSVVDY